MDLQLIVTFIKVAAWGNWMETFCSELCKLLECKLCNLVCRISQKFLTHFWWRTIWWSACFSLSLARYHLFKRSCTLSVFRTINKIFFEASSKGSFFSTAAVSPPQNLITCHTNLKEKTNAVKGCFEIEKKKKKIVKKDWK